MGGSVRTHREQDHCNRRCWRGPSRFGRPSSRLKRDAGNEERPALRRERARDDVLTSRLEPASSSSLALQRQRPVHRRCHNLDQPQHRQLRQHRTAACILAGWRWRRGHRPALNLQACLQSGLAFPSRVPMWQTGFLMPVSQPGGTHHPETKSAPHRCRELGRLVA